MSTNPQQDAINILALLKKNFSKKQEDKLTSAELRELLKYKSTLSADEWSFLSEKARIEVKLERENTWRKEKKHHHNSTLSSSGSPSASTNAGVVDNRHNDTEKDEVSEGEIPVGPRRTKKSDDGIEEMREYLELLKITCGVTTYKGIHIAVQKAMTDYQQLLEHNTAMQAEIAICKRKTKKLYDKVLALSQWRSSIRDKAATTHESLKTLKRDHEDLRNSTRHSLQMFYRDLAAFSAALPKLLDGTSSTTPTKRGHSPIARTASPVPPTTFLPPPQLNSTPHYPNYYSPVPPRASTPPPHWATPSHSNTPNINHYDNSPYRYTSNSTQPTFTHNQSHNSNMLFTPNTTFTSNTHTHTPTHTPSKEYHTQSDYNVNTVDMYNTNNNSQLYIRDSASKSRDSLGNSNREAMEAIKQRVRKKKEKKGAHHRSFFVCARICPIFRNILNNDKSMVILPSEDTIIVSRDTSLVDSKTFSLDAFFPAHVPNQEMADKLKIFPEYVFEGKNAAVFTLGESSSGKSWTMNGTGESCGLMDRLVEAIFTEISARKASHQNVEHSVRVSAAHFLFDGVEDTIAVMTKRYGIVEQVPTQNRPLEHAQDLTSIPLSSYEEFQDLHSLVFDEACYNHHHLPPPSAALPQVRPSACTMYRPEIDGDMKCQLTHRVVIVRVETRNLVNNETDSHSLTFVDLAAFETISKPNPNLDEMRKKIRNANVLRVKKDLHTLSDVLISIRKNEHTIPYRRCRLAHFLKNELDANCKVGVITTVLAAVEHYDEAIDALSFAAKIS